jgi:hypothetical protein
MANIQLRHAAAVDEEDVLKVVPLRAL